MMFTFQIFYSQFVCFLFLQQVHKLLLLRNMLSQLQIFPSSAQPFLSGPHFKKKFLLTDSLTVSGTLLQAAGRKLLLTAVRCLLFQKQGSFRSKPNPSSYARQSFILYMGGCHYFSHMKSLIPFKRMRVDMVRFWDFLWNLKSQKGITKLILWAIDVLKKGLSLIICNS